MFIKAGDFKKMINKAAASAYGLHVKNDGEAIWLGSAWWHMWILRSEIPNQQLGDLIALGGMLPDPDEAVLVQKEQSGQQVEMFDTLMESAMDMFRQCNSRFYVTRTVVWDGGYQRVLQSDERLLAAICVDNEMVAAVRPEVIRLDRKESIPEGPMLAAGRESSVVCWANNHMAFAVAICHLSATFMDVQHMNQIRMARMVETREDSGEE